jgi:hypothetical protein
MKFRAYNSGKITDYEVLMRLLYIALQRYICKGQKLEDTVLTKNFATQNNMTLWCYEGKQRYFTYPKERNQRCKKEHSTIQRKDRRPARMISTIHKARMVNTGRRNRNTNLEITNQPHCIVPYNKFMKGVDRTDQHISYCSTLRKTVM